MNSLLRIDQVQSNSLKRIGKDSVRYLRRVSRTVLMTVCSVVLPFSLVHGEALGEDEVLLLDVASGLDFRGGVSLSMAPPATLEFLVAATWSKEPAYDPCLLSLEGQDGVAYSVHVRADRKAIGLFASGGYATLPFDFSDGRMHSVTLVSYSSTLSEFFVDGNSVGVIPLGPPGIPAEMFHLGSLDGTQAPFTGALARLRFWQGVPVSGLAASDLLAQTTVEGQNMSLLMYAEPDEAKLMDRAAILMGTIEDDVRLDSNSRTLAPIQSLAD